jgi:hypothetical protein
MRRLYGWLFGVIVGLAVAAFYAPALGTARQDALELKPHAVVQHKPIDEMSGIARSRTYEGVYWVHNDSGDRARIFPIRLDGSVVIPPFVSRRDSSDRPKTRQSSTRASKSKARSTSTGRTSPSTATRCISPTRATTGTRDATWQSM